MKQCRKRQKPRNVTSIFVNSEIRYIHGIKLKFAKRRTPKATTKNGFFQHETVSEKTKPSKMKGLLDSLTVKSGPYMLSSGS